MALTYVLLCLVIVSANGISSDETLNTIEQQEYDFTNFLSEVVGLNFKDSIFQFLEKLYEEWRDALAYPNDRNSTSKVILNLVERFQSLVGFKKSDLKNGIQNWLLTNMANSFEFLENVSPNFELVRRLKMDFLEPVKDGVAYPKGLMKAVLNVFWTMTDFFTPFAPVIREVVQDNEFSERFGKPLLQDTHALSDPFVKLEKLAAPFKFLKDLIVLAKIQVVKFIRSLWDIKRSIGNFILAKFWIVWEQAKSIFFGPIDMYFDAMRYLRNELFAPIDFISSRMLKTNVSEECMMHYFCVYGKNFLRLQDDYPVLSKLNTFFPKQKFPVIFLDDFLKGDSKLAYSPKLATALMSGKENGECEKYPAIYCS